MDLDFLFLIPIIENIHTDGQDVFFSAGTHNTINNFCSPSIRHSRDSAHSKKKKKKKSDTWDFMITEISWITDDYGCLFNIT